MEQWGNTAMMEYDIMSDLNPNPYDFFSTAAGPDMTDLVGPPQGVLDVYNDGSPLATSATQVGADAAAGGGGLPPFFQRADVRAFMMLAAGLIILHLHMKS